jgi:AcrR family transcriptional regulator
VTTKKTRRRGAELDHALLAAAWDELLENGYENLTMESVAERAGTSRPVIARRWTDRLSLVMAAVRHWHEDHPLATPDTGSLRGDLLAYLEDKSANRAELTLLLRIRITALADAAETTPAQLFERMGVSLTAGLEEVWDRAGKRGEVDPSRLHPRVRTLPFVLISAELARTRQPIPRQTIEEILDVVVLPLVIVRSAVMAR